MTIENNDKVFCERQGAKFFSFAKLELAVTPITTKSAVKVVYK